ncbi:LOB domain-containing protein 24-like [Solanum pennellii]|uniref:LOB domain-containing protein 24-like n=1 Tax=Solanum pennellii TaxID=28526 RepID=A0ABM1UVK6_SOLPN|nr:LOB domain-containing protein 24-like [Solanum pennellii]
MNDADARGKCAACKYQNKRCDENCPFAPFFPSNKVDEFDKVIRLFSIDFLKDMLNSVTANEEKAKMVETLILEAKIRSENPVYGSIAVTEKLNLEIEKTQKELDLIQKTIAFYKELGGRSSLNKKNEEISTSGKQSLQDVKKARVDSNDNDET